MSQTLYFTKPNQAFMFSKYKRLAVKVKEPVGCISREGNSLLPSPEGTDAVCPCDRRAEGPCLFMASLLQGRQPHVTSSSTLGTVSGVQISLWTLGRHLHPNSTPLIFLFSRTASTWPWRAGCGGQEAVTDFLGLTLGQGRCTQSLSRPYGSLPVA